MQHEPEDELEQQPSRSPPPAVPADVLREVTRLSQPPAPGTDAYVLAPPPAWSPNQQPVPAHDRVLAAIAHAAILFGFLGIGFLVSVGINVGLWLYSRHSPYVAYHAKQAGCYQVFVLVFNVAYVFLLLLLFGFYAVYPQWTWVGVLAAWLTGLGVCWFVGSILLGVVAAVRVLRGKAFAYPVFGRK